MLAMSSAISKCKYSTFTVAQKKLSHQHHRNNLNLIPPGLFIQHPSTSTTFLHPTPVDNNNFPFGINWNNFSQSQLSKPLDTFSPGIFSFNGCQVNIDINNSMHLQQNNNAKRKQHTIYSDSEESQD